METYNDLDILLAISKEIKKSIERPVILLTMKDYALDAFNHLVNLRAAMVSTPALESVANIIQTFHIEWLHAVQDVEKLKKQLKDTPRDNIVKAINFTIECASKRFIYIQRYIVSLQLSKTQEEKTLIHTELKTIKDMRESLNCNLRDKQNIFQNIKNHREYYVKVNYEIQELLNWLDRLNDHIAIEFSKVLLVPHLPTDLTACLNLITSEIAEASRDNGDCAENDSLKVRVHFQDLRIKTIIEKLKALENHIRLITTENASKSLVLQQKELYLKERLKSLVNLKLSLNDLVLQKKEYRVNELSISQETHIFNHLLPPRGRCRLVDKLVRLWDSVLRRDSETKSIVSIVSDNDTNEISNDLGDFIVDNHGRKIYYRDKKKYQLNEKNNLVPVDDDENHVYFYDECGRYYISNENQRIYKDHDSASEYMMDSSALLVKIKEEKDGKLYIYDHLGRFYVNEVGKHIYIDEDSTSEYEQDGFGNLVKIRDDEEQFPSTCPNEPIVTSDINYLKQTVGMALKKCIAEVILHQPADPINYLADCLEKYRYNIEARQKLLAKNKERKAETELLNRELESHNIAGMPNTSRQSYYVEEEQSFVDYNYSNYESDESRNEIT